MTTTQSNIVIVNRIGQTIDVRESARVCQITGAVNRFCWQNSITALRHCYRAEPAACYVEGHALSKHGLVAEHGWLERADGTIIDPTPIWHTDLTDIPCYFAGGRFRADDLRGLRVTAARFPRVHWPSYWRGPHAPAYKQSLLDCYCLAFNQPPEQVRHHLGWES